MNVSPRYVTNEAGERTEVILPLASYEELLEDLSDLAAIADRCNEPTTSNTDFIEELKKDGILPDYDIAIQNKALISSLKEGEKLNVGFKSIHYRKELFMEE